MQEILHSYFNTELINKFHIYADGFELMIKSFEIAPLQLSKYFLHQA